MTATLQPLGRLSERDAVELACRAHVGVWAERYRGLTNAALHWEWAELIMTARRLCLVAPREHAKTQIVTVNQSAWRCRYQPGIWGHVFSATDDLAEQRLSEINDAVRQTNPWMIDGASVDNSTETVYANGSRITVAGAGSAVRGGHPDFVVGDDVLTDKGCASAEQRRKTSRWWFGEVAGLAHAGTYRDGSGARVWMPPTSIHLVGTPFHSQDLLLSMRHNPIYSFRRYAAEFDPGDLVAGTMAVEVA